MRYLITTLFFLLIINSFSQRIFDDARFTKVKQVENGYISIIQGAQDNRLKKYLVEKYKGHYVGGISFHDKEGEILWVRTFEGRIILDIKIKKNKVIVLNADWHNSKTYSSAELYETELDIKGRFLNEIKISSIKSKVSNSRIRGFYDEEGQIWELINWENSDNILINNIKVKGEKKDNIRITNHSKDSPYSYIISGDYLKILTQDVYNNKIGFLIYGDNLKTSNNVYGKEETVLFNFKTNGKLIDTKSISKGDVFVKHLEITQNGFLIGGSFKGDTSQPKPSAFFLNKELNSPKSSFRNEKTRNGFITHVNKSMTIDWFNILESKYDVSLESMSADNNNIVIGIQYKDLLKINNKEIKSLNKTKTEYEYSDATLVFFNSNGEVTFSERLIGNGYEKIGAQLSDNKLILVGNFLDSVKMFDYKLKDSSINGCNFLIFK